MNTIMHSCPFNTWKKYSGRLSPFEFSQTVFKPKSRYKHGPTFDEEKDTEEEGEEVQGGDDVREVLVDVQRHAREGVHCTRKER